MDAAVFMLSFSIKNNKYFPKSLIKVLSVKGKEIKDLPSTKIYHKNGEKPKMYIHSQGCDHLPLLQC